MKYLLILSIFLIGCEKSSLPAVSCTFQQDIEHWLEFHEGEEIEIISNANGQVNRSFVDFTGLNAEWVDFVLRSNAPECGEKQFVTCGQTARNNIILACESYE